MLINDDYRNNKGTFDVCIFDPPFDIWHSIDYVPTAKTYICFTNFQNRHHVQERFGNPKFEMIWHFLDGRWVSHKMPRHTHEHILIYGELANEAYTGPINVNREPINKGYGAIGRDKLTTPRLYQPRERKMLNSVITVPRRHTNACGLWGKPLEVAMPILEWLVSPNDDVWDGFAGSGTFGVCVNKLGANYFGSELDTKIYNAARERLNNINYPLFDRCNNAV